MENINIDQFIINRIHKKGYGLHVDFSIQVKTGKELLTEGHKVTIERPIHEDFVREIFSLRPFVMKVLRYTNIIHLTTDPQFECSEKQSSFLTSLYNNITNAITINGCRFATIGTAIEGIIIEYSLAGHSSQTMTQKTYKISLHQDDQFHGFEEELLSVCNNLRSMAFDYIFKGVGGNLELIFKDDQQPSLL